MIKDYEKEVGKNNRLVFDYSTQRPEGQWSNVTQSCGFIFQTLVNGQSQYQCASNDDLLYTNHPRTFIGFKEDGTPVMMVVDGRGKTSADKNDGVSLFQGAELMKLAGCVNAYNLDGGGSSTLIVRNEWMKDKGVTNYVAFEGDQTVRFTSEGLIEVEE
jgi:exopolysaccharide biosynthesis protein